MQCSCQQADLSRTLSIVNRAVSAKPTLPVLANVLLTLQEGRLILTGYDLEIGIRTEVPVQGDLVKSQRSVAVPAKLLHDMVSAIGEGEVTLELTETHDVLLKASRGQYTLRGVPAEDYPDFPALEDDGSRTFEVAARDLTGGLRRTLFATAKESGRAFTSGLFLQSEGDMLVLVATDGRRLALDKIPLADRSGIGKKELTALLPAANMEDLLAILPQVTGEDARIRFALSNRLARVQAGPTEIIMHLLDATFPDYEKVIPRDFKGKVELPREDFLRTIRQVAIVARQKEGRDIAILSTDGDRMTVQARVTTNQSSARYELPTSREGDDLNVAFNYQYLLDAITNTEADSVELSYSGQVDPGVMRLPVNPHYTYVLMPVRQHEA